MPDPVSTRPEDPDIRSSEVSTLLGELAGAMGADVAVLYAVDSAARVLEVVGTSGIDLVAQTAVRVPIGHGFVGQIASAMNADVIADLSVNGDWPDLSLARRLGIASVLGVALADRGQIRGVLYVGSATAAAFSGDDAAKLHSLARRLDEVDAARRSAEEHAAARILQRSLLPSTPPQIAGLDLAARYVPADGHLGGDWYDVFALPGGRVGLVMGDVAGHGLHSAIVMGRLRSALRSYALDYEDPAEVLTALNRKITHFEAGVFATVLCGFATAPYDEVVFSSAGHLPPVLARPGQPAVLAEVPPDPPLGAHFGVTRRATAVRFAPGSSLCLYTDGLVERRSSLDGDQHRAGLTTLQATFRAGRAESAAAVVLDTLLDGPVTDDDVAILIARRALESGL